MTRPPPPPESLEEIRRGLDHDLRTPAANILGFIDLVRETPGSALTPDQLEFLSRAEENCQQLLDMLGRLAALAR